MEMIDYERHHQPVPIVIEQAQNTHRDLVHYIMQESWVKEQVKKALPSNISVERILRAAATEIRGNQKLSQCDPRSFVGCILDCAQLGLTPGSALGHVYFVPFYSSQERKQLCKMIIGYQGLIDLAYRGGLIENICAEVVREGDVFRRSYGTSPKFEHEPLDDESKPITHVYAYANLKKGGFLSEVLTKKQIEKLLEENKGKDSWKEHPVAMLRKTALRRLCKYIPKNPLLEEAIQMDEAYSREDVKATEPQAIGQEGVAERLMNKLKRRD
jgi:recombination protein RecT